MIRHKLTLTTASDGTVTGYTPRVSGKVHSVQYVKDGATPFSNGVDFTVTAEATGENIWTEADVNASAVRYPRAPTHSQAGVAALYAAGGVGVLAPIAVANDRIKVAIAQGGSAKLGAIHVLIDK